MGTEITANSGTVSGTAEKQPNTDKPAAADSSAARTTAPRTGTSHRGTGTGTTAGTETGKSAEKTGEVAVLTEEQQKAEARRQQKAESARRAEARRKAIENGEPIPEWAQKRATGTAAKKQAAKKAEPQQLDASSIQSLIKTVFDLIATRPNCQHWALSDAEAMELAKPIADILADYAAVSETLTQNSKYIALVMAAFAIAAPRVVLSTQIRKAKKEAQHGIIAKSKTEIRTESKSEQAGKAGTGRAGSADNPAANGSQHVPSLYELVPTV